MTTQEPSGQRESFTEWGVRWKDGFYLSPPLPALDTEAAMREFAAGIPADQEPVVVCRTVISTPWREPVTADDVVAAIEAGGVVHCNLLGFEYWPDCDRCEGTGQLEECPDCEGIGKIRPAPADGAS